MLYLQAASAAYIALRGSVSYGTMIAVVQRGRTMSEENYTYILECADGTLYCGWTNHLKERVAAHNAGKGAKYTKNRRPVVLKYYETFSTKQEAMRREWAVKQLSRKEKLELIEAFQWFEPIDPELVPVDSLLREFIGGGSYKYH